MMSMTELFFFTSTCFFPHPYLQRMGLFLFFITVYIFKSWLVGLDWVSIFVYFLSLKLYSYIIILLDLTIGEFVNNRFDIIMIISCIFVVLIICDVDLHVVRSIGWTLIQEVDALTTGYFAHKYF
jgi:hypothetical protein